MEKACGQEAIQISTKTPTMEKACGKEAIPISTKTPTSENACEQNVPTLPKIIA